MLRISDLSVSFGRSQILRGIDLQLDRGDSLAILGESGAGKTSLGRALMYLSEGSCNGEVLLDGVDLLQLPEERLRLRLCIGRT